jgi:HK97 family phage portal protein
MSWITRTGDWFRTKLNPAQSRIAQGEGSRIGTTAKIGYLQAFQKLEAVNRSVNMVVSACASLDYDVKDKIHEGIVTGIRQKQLSTLLNFRPNPYQSAQDFRMAIFQDLILDGNVFVHFDGVFMYHLPAKDVQILPDTKTFVQGYLYNGLVEFKESEVFHFKDINSRSIYRGSSRVEAADQSINLLYSMKDFQDHFFDNGAVFGLILTSDNTLSQVAKDKTIQNWLQRYSAKSGGKKPVILDSGLKPHSVSQTSFKEMDFDLSIKTHSAMIMQAIGVPPILMEGGNNANISPNLRLFYLETVMPIVRRFTSSLERYYGYDIEAITSSVGALQPELKELAAYHSTLVNAGIITANEARKELRYEPIAGNDEIRIPANIAGSAANPAQGGRPASAKE